jgi:cation:H+ antiporter
MTDTMHLLLLFGGCTYLILGGDLLVRGALALAQRTSISPMVIGLTVVAIGTSAPELIVSVYSAVSGHAGIAVGNVVGSNIANVLMVLGIPALIHPIVCTDRGMLRQVAFMVAVSVLFIVLCWAGYLSQLDGLLLLCVLITGAVLTTRGKMSMPGIDTEEADEQIQRVVGIPQNTLTIIALILAGSLFLPLGADLAVDGAVGAAAWLGVSEAAIGSTLVAIGTSLPELSTTVIAAFHRNSNMALGNVIGSNVLNILAIMGIIDVPVPAEFLIRDFWVMLACALVLAGFVAAGRPVGRVAGGFFCAGYIAYCATTL